MYKLVGPCSNTSNRVLSVSLINFNALILSLLVHFSLLSSKIFQHSFATLPRELKHLPNSKGRSLWTFEPGDPRDYGWMYARSFEDINGHLWDMFYMNESAMKRV
jgi:hypothetical protein